MAQTHERIKLSGLSGTTRKPDMNPNDTTANERGNEPERSEGSLKRMVSRHSLHWMIRDSEESVWLIRHTLQSATERPLTDHERLIGYLCEQLMSANVEAQRRAPETGVDGKETK